MESNTSLNRFGAFNALWHRGQSYTLSILLLALLGCLRPIRGEAGSAESLRVNEVIGRKPLGYPKRLAVIPFLSATGDPTLADAQRALPGMVRMYLNTTDSGVEILKQNDFDAVLSAWKWPPTNALNQAQAREIAMALKIDLLVCGRLKRKDSR